MSLVQSDAKTAGGHISQRCAHLLEDGTVCGALLMPNSVASHVSRRHPNAPKKRKRSKPNPQIIAAVNGTTAPAATTLAATTTAAIAATTTTTTTTRMASATCPVPYITVADAAPTAADDFPPIASPLSSLTSLSTPARADVHVLLWEAWLRRSQAVASVDHHFAMDLSRLSLGVAGLGLVSLSNEPSTTSSSTSAVYTPSCTLEAVSLSTEPTIASSFTPGPKTLGVSPSVVSEPFQTDAFVWNDTVGLGHVGPPGPCMESFPPPSTVKLARPLPLTIAVDTDGCDMRNGRTVGDSVPRETAAPKLSSALESTDFSPAAAKQSDIPATITESSSASTLAFESTSIQWDLTDRSRPLTYHELKRLRVGDYLTCIHEKGLCDDTGITQGIVESIQLRQVHLLSLHSDPTIEHPVSDLSLWEPDSGRYVFHRPKDALWVRCCRVRKIVAGRPHVCKMVSSQGREMVYDMRIELDTRSLAVKISTL